jgi:hypothetical protein
MTLSDRRRIGAAADDTIAKMRAARSATNEAGAGITKGAAPAELQPLLDRVRATHEAALNGARNFATTLSAAGVESISSSVQLAVAKVEAAKTAADQFGSAPTQPQANTTRDADDEAVTHIADLKAAFQNAPELEHISRPKLSDLLGWFTQLTSQQVLGLIAGGAVFILATVGLVAHWHIRNNFRFLLWFRTEGGAGISKPVPVSKRISISKPVSASQCAVFPESVAVSKRAIFPQSVIVSKRHPIDSAVPTWGHSSAIWLTTPRRD